MALSSPSPTISSFQPSLTLWNLCQNSRIRSRLLWELHKRPNDYIISWLVWNSRLSDTWYANSVCVVMSKDVQLWIYINLSMSFRRANWDSSSINVFPRTTVASESSYAIRSAFFSFGIWTNCLQTANILRFRQLGIGNFRLNSFSESRKCGLTCLT